MVNVAASAQLDQEADPAPAEAFDPPAAVAAPHALRIVNSVPPIDLPGAERAVRALLVALGQNPDAEHLLQTPRRVASAYAELLTPRDFDLTTFPN
ncbi:MAG TPA: GTP cyclohydrolase I, partial [Jatrophihabitans sp.]|nr:GTP cyclohydrolase I [Jatrophihabitans sp.]